MIRWALFSPLFWWKNGGSETFVQVYIIVSASAGFELMSPDKEAGSHSWSHTCLTMKFNQSINIFPLLISINPMVVPEQPHQCVLVVMFPGVWSYTWVPGCVICLCFFRPETPRAQDHASAKDLPVYPSLMSTRGSAMAGHWAGRSVTGQLNKYREERTSFSNSAYNQNGSLYSSSVPSCLHLSYASSKLLLTGL